MKTLSVGMDSTLGNWRKLSVIAFGEGSSPVRFFDEKIEVEGENSEVLADEAQLLNALMTMFMESEKK